MLPTLDQGVYHFTGNRNVKYLMELCEELDLYVLAAPGPYICAETQAGGIFAILLEYLMNQRSSILACCHAKHTTSTL